MGAHYLISEKMQRLIIQEQVSLLWAQEPSPRLLTDDNLSNEKLPLPLNSSLPASVLLMLSPFFRPSFLRRLPLTPTHPHGMSLFTTGNWKQRTGLALGRKKKEKIEN